MLASRSAMLSLAVGTELNSWRLMKRPWFSINYYCVYCAFVSPAWHPKSKKPSNCSDEQIHTTEALVNANTLYTNNHSTNLKLRLIKELMNLVFPPETVCLHLIVLPPPWLPLLFWPAFVLVCSEPENEECPSKFLVCWDMRFWVCPCHWENWASWWGHRHWFGIFPLGLKINWMSPFK